MALKLTPRGSVNIRSVNPSVHCTDPASAYHLITNAAPNVTAEGRLGCNLQAIGVKVEAGERERQTKKHKIRKSEA